jgi:hypothetical protein
VHATWSATDTDLVIHHDDGDHAVGNLRPAHNACHTRHHQALRHGRDSATFWEQHRPESLSYAEVIEVNQGVVGLASAVRSAKRIEFSARRLAKAWAQVEEELSAAGIEVGSPEHLRQMKARLGLRVTKLDAAWGEFVTTCSTLGISVMEQKGLHDDH